MVGVPGRSKGCATCRKRKKGCDLQRPSCGQCRKACVPCGGYKREYSFVRMDPGSISSHPSPSTSSTVSSSSSCSSLARSAFRERYVEMFWQIYLPRDWAAGSSAAAARRALGTTWLGILQGATGGETQPLHKATLAMSLSAVGRRDDQEHVVEQGARLYTEALRASASALAGAGWRDRADTLLAATRLYSLYEAMFGSDASHPPTQLRSWLAHCAGDIALITSRPPESFALGEAHHLFSDGRLHLTAMALRTRKKTFLSDPQWKTLPWSQIDKTPRERLIDILVDIPMLFELMDTATASADAVRREKLLGHAWAGFVRLDRELSAWHACYAPPAEVSARLRFTAADVPPSQPSVPLDDLAVAHLETLYHTTALILYSLVRDVLWREYGINVVSGGDDHGMNLSKDAGEMCRELIRTVPLFCHPDVGTFRTHLVTFPITVAAMYMSGTGARRKDMDEEREILTKCLLLPGCAGIRGFVGSMGGVVLTEDNPRTLSPRIVVSIS